jgi:hypothetical protein
LEFALREGGNEQKKRAPTERLLFRLWDRRTFVLAHADSFSYCTRWNVRKAQEAFTDEKNTYLLESVRAESLAGAGREVLGLWFIELLEQGVIGGSAFRGTPEEKAAKQAQLKKWGYAEEQEEDTAPFVTNTSGVLSSPLHSGDSIFMENARRKLGTLFIPVEPFVAAAAIGMVSLHILTANGMRINELLQLRASTDCIVPLVIPPAPGMEDQAPAVHWEARVIPKGHSKPKPYYFDDEHLRLLSVLKLMLCERYGIDPQKGGDLPCVPFRGRDPHRFPVAPYLFQYEHKGLTQVDIRACMRFLVHGRVFQTLDGRKVTVLPHLLRHGFATWALNVAKEPIDIVAAILHQKNLAVARYYGRPNPRLIAERSHGLIVQISSYIDVEDLILRSPEEIRYLLQSAQTTHGTLARVRGGRCLVSGECPIFFACIGCAAKAPGPAQREEVEEFKQVTLMHVDRARKKGLMLEVIQLEKKLKQCDAELQEMTMIELCREDEQREPEVNFEIDA